MAINNFNVWQIAACVLTILEVSAAESAPSFRQYHRGKVASPAINFLQNLTIPVPSFAYNISGRDYDERDISQLDQFKAASQYYRELFASYEITDVQLTNTSDLACTTNIDADYYNNDTCLDGAYLDPAEYVIDSLKWFLPQDACEWTDGVCASWVQSVSKPVNETGQFLEQLKLQEDIAQKNQTRSYYRLISDYIGVGFRIEDSCRANINMALGSLDKFNEAGWSAATTLTALIPALLTIGNLYVPKSSEVFSTSFLVGIMSAMFSLGLPVRGISGVPTEQQADTVSFSYKARVLLQRFGKARSQNVLGGRHSANENFDLSSFQKWSTNYDAYNLDDLNDEQEMTNAIFSKIRQRTKDWSSRVHMWQLPAFVIAGAQFVLFLVAISPLFLSYGTPLLLFDCKNYWTSAWLLIAAGISAVFRCLMWEKGSHERVKLYDLSEFAVQNLRDFADSTLLRLDGTQHAHVETDLPPLHPPLINAMGLSIHHGWQAVVGLFSRNKSGSGNKQAQNITDEEIGFFKATFAYIRLLWDDFVSALKNPKAFLQGGFKSDSTPEAARRWRPLIVLMHLSTAGRNPVATLFTGLVEGFILILLTAFFAAQWGGNLYVMCYITAILLVAVSLGRALGLIHVVYSTKTYGLHIIEHQDPKEVRGCLRLVCSMREVLVHVNGAWFFEGHRLDERAGWLDFQRCYNLGHLDSEHDKNSHCTCSYVALAGVASVVPSTSAGTSINKPLPVVTTRTSSMISSLTNNSTQSLHGTNPAPANGVNNNNSVV